MCGFTGFSCKEPLLGHEILQAIGQQIVHRGPDHQGVFVSEDQRNGAVHQRLAILDLDARSNQPFFSDDQRYLIVYNGEIYNFKEIKQELIKSGVSFHTESDTEVVLKNYLAKGADCLQDFNGMFAFGIYDKVEKSWFLARDRMGIKPLYYVQQDNLFAFSSDLKSFQAAPFVEKKLNKAAIWQFLFFGYIPQPDTIFLKTHKLLPGHWLKIDAHLDIHTSAYWKIPVEAEKIDPNEASERLKELLEKSVERRLISDVELGMFSSGGLDSSAIIKLANRPDLSNFTIGFKHQSNTLDLDRSKELAEQLDLRHHIQILEEDSLEAFDDFFSILDEPLSEASILPLLHNFKAVKEAGIKVILAGDGADEILGGYEYFALMESRSAGKLPKNLLQGVAGIGKSILSNTKAESKLGKFRDIYLDRTVNALTQADPSLCHQLFLSHNNQPDIEDLSNTEIRTIQDAYMDQLYTGFSGNLDELLAIEVQSALVNKHLAKVDKSSMAHSVEARVPFLDHNLVTLAFQIPELLKRSKKVLRQALEGQLPSTILTDRKRGFNLPLKAWVRRYLCAPQSTRIQWQELESLGILDMNSIHRIMEQHKSGIQDHSRTLWALYVLSGWLKNNRYSS